MKKSLWEKYQEQLNEPWPITDFDEYKEWHDKCFKVK